MNLERDIAAVSRKISRTSLHVFSIILHAVFLARVHSSGPFRYILLVFACHSQFVRTWGGSRRLLAKSKVSRGLFQGLIRHQSETILTSSTCSPQQKSSRQDHSSKSRTRETGGRRQRIPALLLFHPYSPYSVDRQQLHTSSKSQVKIIVEAENLIEKARSLHPIPPYTLSSYAASAFHTGGRQLQRTTPNEIMQSHS